MRPQQLTEAQITALLDPPTDQRELVRHYTLSAADLAAIRRCRGDHNRLGHALMLCYLRYPGRPLKAGERPPRPLLLFIAGQIDAFPSWGGWNAHCSPSTGWGMRNCAVRPAGNSTRAKHATAWRGLSSSIASARSATAPMRNQQHRASGLNLLV